MFYNARWYDPALGRFMSADTVVPEGVQGWDRYAYAANDPVLYNDPTGHKEACGALGRECGDGGAWLNRIKRHTHEDESGGRIANHACTALTPCVESGTKSGKTGTDLQAIGYFTKYGNQAAQLLTQIGNQGLPLYKQWHGAGTLGPYLEGGGAALLQIGADMDNPNLTPLQRLGRPALIGAEGAFTEVVSEPWAAGGATVGGALGVSAGEIVGSPVGAIIGGGIGAAAGYEAGSLAVTAFFDAVVFEPLNAATGLFP